MDLIGILLIFAALITGVFIGKKLFRASADSEKMVLEEKINNLGREIDTHKQQLTQQVQYAEKQLSLLNTDKEKLIEEKQSLMIGLSRKETEFENIPQKIAEQKEEVEQLQEKFTKEFENLANKILEEKSTKFTEQNKENIKNILNPLQEKILLFEKKVEDSQKENIGIHASLKEQLVQLQTQNLKITQEAENLTKALKGDSKIQGNWGELDRKSTRLNSSHVRI